MPKLFNTVTKKYDFMPESYIGKFPYAEEAVEVAPVVEEVKPAKKKAKYIADAVDSDGDGKVQDGTEFERPVGTELSPEELTAIQESDSAL
ncbi:MAG: hypothetical protein EBS38_08990 [Actinobacteria bacterium]|nr:hypothetical protein [Actinomycetota bacterium]